jgi:MFS family permease
MVSSGPALLRHDTTFRLFWLSRLASVLGSTLTRVVLPLNVLERTGSPALAAAVTTVSLAPTLLLGLPAGVFADRRDRMAITRRCETVSAVITLLLSIALMASDRIVWPVFVAVALIAVAAILFDAASFGVLAQIVPREEIGTANSLLYGSNTVLSLLGPALGGFVYQHFGVGTVLVLNTATFGVSAVLLYLIRVAVPGTHAGGERSTSFLADMRDGLLVIWRATALRFLVIAGAACGIAGGALAACGVLIVTERFRQPGSTLGLLVSTIGLGAFVGSLLLSWLGRRVPHTLIALTGFPVAAVVFLAVAWAPGLPVLFVASFAWGVVYTVLIINNVTLRMSMLPQSLQARVNTTARTIAWGGEPVGAAIVTALVGGFSVQVSMAICAVPLILLSAVVWATPLRTRDPDLLRIPEPDGGSASRGAVA